MKETIMKYKWILLLTCEITAWIFTVLMFVARYGLQNQVVFWICTVIAVSTGWIPHIVLSAYDCWRQKKVTPFALFVIALIIFGSIYGEKLILMIDTYLQTLFT